MPTQYFSGFDQSIIFTSSGHFYVPEDKELRYAGFRRFFQLDPDLKPNNAEILAVKRNGKGGMTEKEALLWNLAHPNHPAKFLEITNEKGEKDFRIIMPYIEGKTLRELMHEIQIGSEEHLKMGIAICEALMDLHAKKICHTDLHGENIIMQKLKNGNYQAFIIDFGWGADLIDEREPDFQKQAFDNDIKRVMAQLGVKDIPEKMPSLPNIHLFLKAELLAKIQAREPTKKCIETRGDILIEKNPESKDLNSESQIFQIEIENYMNSSHFFQPSKKPQSKLSDNKHDAQNGKKIQAWLMGKIFLLDVALNFATDAEQQGLIYSKFKMLHLILTDFEVKNGLANVYFDFKNNLLEAFSDEYSDTKINKISRFKI